MIQLAKTAEMASGRDIAQLSDVVKSQISIHLAARGLGGLMCFGCLRLLK